MRMVGPARSDVVFRVRQDLLSYDILPGRSDGVACFCDFQSLGHRARILFQFGKGQAEERDVTPICAGFWLAMSLLKGDHFVRDQFSRLHDHDFGDASV